MKRALIPAAAMVLGLGVTACGSEPFDPCAVNPTYQATDGQWYEADGEPLDDDPCDSDDFMDDGHGHKIHKKKPGLVKPTITVKPIPRATPAKVPAPKTPVKPAPKTTRR